jgi:hypothetical protein
VGFRAVDQVALIVMVVLYIASSIFYFAYLADKQKFSEEEKKEMFKAYLINGKLNFLSHSSPAMILFTFLLANEQQRKRKKKQQSSPDLRYPRAGNKSGASTSGQSNSGHDSALDIAASGTGASSSGSTLGSLCQTITAIFSNNKVHVQSLPPSTTPANNFAPLQTSIEDGKEDSSVKPSVAPDITQSVIVPDESQHHANAENNSLVPTNPSGADADV